MDLEYPCQTFWHDFQYDDADFPREYTQLGLRTLTQLSKFDDEKTQVTLVLTDRIISAANRSLPNGDPILHFDYIRSCFHEAAAGVRYGVAVIALLPSEFSVQTLWRRQNSSTSFAGQLRDNSCAGI